MKLKIRPCPVCGKQPKIVDALVCHKTKNGSKDSDQFSIGCCPYTSLEDTKIWRLIRRWNRFTRLLSAGIIKNLEVDYFDLAKGEQQ